ncbi:hypothetical protein HZA85_01960 [Candidatus Uhrbacteria bacterium]|nr:hypothetical protein [Candidatus Uhrbacteria bacterium]
MNKTIMRQFIGALTIVSMLAMVFGVFAWPALAASAPNIVTYQGRVLDANGVPVTSSSLSMKFFLYTAASGGTCVWSNSSGTCNANTPGSTTARSVTLTNGLFTENLGDTAAGTPYAAIADSTFADNAGIYLEVIIAGETLSPRKQLVAAPYALNADTIDGLDSTQIGGTFETGSNGAYEDDAAVIVGTDAAFSYASGGVGDLRVADQLEVMSDGYLDNNLVVGASTSSTETISNAGFSLGGNDLFVAGEAGIEGILYNDGGITSAGTVTGADFACTDCLDFAELSDTLTLDASTSITQDGTKTFTITNSGSGDTVVNLSSTGNFVIQDGGSPLWTFQSSGKVLLNTTTGGIAYFVFGADQTRYDDTDGNMLFDVTDAGTTGNIRITGDLEVRGGDLTTNQTTFNLVNTTATTLNVGGAATTALNIGAGSTAYAGINIGTGAGGNTINIGTNNTVADDTNIGSAQDQTSIVGDDWSVTDAGLATFAANVNANGGLDVDDAFVVSDGGGLTTSQSADFNGDISIADTNIAFDGASTTFTTTGAFTLTPSGSVLLGDGGDTLQINSSDWDVSTTGDFSGVGAITMDGALAANGGSITSTTTLDVNPTGDFSVTLAAGESFVVDASSTASTNTDGALDLNIASTTANVVGLSVSATQSSGAIADAELLGQQIILTGNDADGEVIGLEISSAATAAAIADTYSALLRLTNAENTASVVTDAILVTSTSGTSGDIVDALDVSATTITNALNAGQNFIVFDTTRQFGSAAGTITWEDTSGNDLMTLTDNSDTGDVVLSGDLAVNGDDITSDGTLTINPSTYTRIGNVSTPGNASTDDDLYASGAFEVDGTSYFDGVIDVDMADATTTTTSGILDMDITAGDAAVYGQLLTLTQANGATAAREATGLGILLDAEDSDGNLIGMNITNQAGTSSGVAGNYEALLRLTNTEVIASVVTDAILINDTSGTGGTIVDAIDVSDTEITNALNAGQNFIVFDTTRQFGSAAGTITWEDTSGNDLMTLSDNGDTGDVVLSGDLAVNGDDITSDGALTIDPATYTRIGNALTPGNASTDDDLYVSGAFEVDGTSYFDGMVDFDNAGSTFTSTGGYVDADLTVGDQGVGGTADFFNISLTQENVAAGRDAVGINVNLTANDADGDMFGIEIAGGQSSVATAGSYEALLKLVNLEDLASVVTDAIKILSISGTDGDITDGLDASDANITNAVNIGGNAIAGTNFSVDTSGNVTANLATSATANGPYALCHDTNVDGINEAIKDCNGAPTADYAEQYPVTSGVTYGDIVVPGARKITTTNGQTIVQLVKSSQPYQGPVAGIVSDNSSDFTSAGYNVPESENPMPVALVGRVPVNVTNENGSIKVGDYLTTSSTSGFAMKATQVGRVIGMALDDFDGTTGQVMVQVNNGWFLGDVITHEGTSTLMTSNVVMAPLSTATAAQPSANSYGLSLRGSGWDGSQAKAVEMLLSTSVASANDYRLSVRNTANTEVAYVTNTGTLQIAGDLVLAGKIYPSDRGVVQTSKYIYYDGSEGAGGDFMRTNAKGWSTGSYDFAEMFPSDEQLQPGEVVVFAGDGQKVKRSMGADSGTIAGIVSTRPGFLAGDNLPGAQPIALAGRVPTHITSENGAVAVGDPLTLATKPGYAMKATHPGPIVGYALEPLSSGEKDILVFVQAGYWSSEALSSAPGTLNQASNFAGATNSNYSALNMTGNIYLAGNEILSVGRIAGIGDAWKIESDGTMTTSGLFKTVITSYTNEPVETIATTSPDVMITLTGTATLSGGKAEIRFEDVSPTFNDVIDAEGPVRVVVTPSGPVSLFVSEKDNNHFVVKAFAGEDKAVAFDWMVSAYRRGYAPASPASPDEPPVDSSVLDEGGAQAEQPSEPIVEPDSGDTTPIAPEVDPLSSVQEAVSE